MILHLNDWKRYPNAIVDTKTKNRSFVKLADKYRQMGIKNYYFMLALIQPQLQGVDPFDPNLDIQTKTMIALECEHNPWYFFREVFRLPSQGSPEPDPLRANRGNIGTYWCYFNHIDVALVQPRQTGKSVGADGINTYVQQIAGRKATFSLITKDHDLRGKNIQRLKDIRELLPDYLNPFDKRVDTNNQTGLTASLYGNKMFSAVAQNDEASALNLGRGSTSETNQVDEGPFCNLIHITMPAFLSSANAARENAARNDSFYGNIFTTTAGKLDTKEGKYIYEMFMGGMMFDERNLFDCGSIKEAQRMVERQTKPMCKPMVYISLSHKQLGYTDEWLYKKITESGSKGDDANRDYFNIWTSGSLRSPLATKVITAIKASQKSPEYIEITDRQYCINWYIPQNQIADRLSKGKYVVGNDTSEGVGKDALTMIMTDSETLEVVCSFAICETNIYSFIEWFVKMMLTYPNIIAIPERKSQGVTLIDALIVALIANNINPFTRIYNTVVDDGDIFKPEKSAEFSFLRRDPITWPPSVADKYKNRFGYGTSSTGKHSRDNLYVNTLSRLADISARKVYDERLITEVCALIDKNGRIDHPYKGHDDTVIAWLLTGWFLLHSKNLSYYGIERPGALAVPLDEDGIVKAVTIKDKLQNDEQNRLITLIKQLSNELETCDDFVEQIRIETQMRSLSQRLHSDLIESKTIDDLIKAAKETRHDVLRERRQGIAG